MGQDNSYTLHCKLSPSAAGASEDDYPVAMDKLQVLGPEEEEEVISKTLTSSLGLS